MLEAVCLTLRDGERPRIYSDHGCQYLVSPSMLFGLSGTEVGKKTPAR